jgi:soluble cytochrome b562
MSRFIQPLESRTLLSATSASIAAEMTNITTDAATVKADLADLKTTATADSKAIALDLKGSKTNAPALKTFQKDEKVLLTKINADGASLLKGSTSATKGAADGNAAIAAPSSAPLANKIQTDFNALAKASTNPLTKLTADAVTTTVDADLTGLNGVSTHAAGAKTNLDTKIAKLLADSATYSNALGALKTDLASLLPAPTTTPSLIGDYKGTLKTKGILFGIGAQTLPLEIIVTAQTLTTLSGSITVSGNTASGTITVTELSTGKVTMALSDSGVNVTLNGNVNVVPTKAGLTPGSVISGHGTLSISGFDVDGDFTVTKIT